MGGPSTCIKQVYVRAQETPRSSERAGTYGRGLKSTRTGLLKVYHVVFGASGFMLVGVKTLGLFSAPTGHMVTYSGYHSRIAVSFISTLCTRISVSTARLNALPSCHDIAAVKPLSREFSRRARRSKDTDVSTISFEGTSVGILRGMPSSTYRQCHLRSGCCWVSIHVAELP
ncbi:hypothetical protein EDB85DRAFT_1073403 [Lactarius pseudohatsudake]|nr:hypothetical protein EDB85DRAFT_1073403 [Lactarius pseudohatsudake]